MESAGDTLLAGTADQLFYRRIVDLLTGSTRAGRRRRAHHQPEGAAGAWDALGDQRGAVVALDPATGDILAMVSKPAFDPNPLAGHDTKQGDRRPVPRCWPTRTGRSTTGRSRVGSTRRARPSSSSRPRPRLRAGCTPRTPAGRARRARPAAEHRSRCRTTSRRLRPGRQGHSADALRISCNTAFGGARRSTSAAPRCAEQARQVRLRPGPADPAHGDTGGLPGPAGRRRRRRSRRSASTTSGSPRCRWRWSALPSPTGAC